MSPHWLSQELPVSGPACAAGGPVFSQPWARWQGTRLQAAVNWGTARNVRCELVKLVDQPEDASASESTRRGRQSPSRRLVRGPATRRG